MDFHCISRNNQKTDTRKCNPVAVTSLGAIKLSFSNGRGGYDSHHMAFHCERFFCDCAVETIPQVCCKYFLP